MYSPKENLASKKALISISGVKKIEHSYAKKKRKKLGLNLTRYTKINSK